MRWIVLPVLAAALCFAEGGTKPACNEENQGRFWPEEANANREAARRLERCGVLEMCSAGVWRYRWKPLTVHITTLRKRHTSAPAACSPEMPRQSRCSRTVSAR